MNDQDVIDAVTAKLAGKFYPGQRVRVAHSNSPFKGREATVVAVNCHWGGEDGYILLDPPMNSDGLWYQGCLEPA